MVVLGFNEFMAVLYNPFWLVFLLIAFLFARTVYQVGGVGVDAVVAQGRQALGVGQCWWFG